MKPFPNVDPQRRPWTATLPRRAILRLGVSATAVGLLAACAPAAVPAGGPATPAAKTGPKGVVLKTELGREYLAYPDVKGTVQFSNPWAGARIPLVERWIKDFTAIYPGIKVENDVAASPQMYEKQVSAIAAGAPPNVLAVLSSNIAFFAETEAILPLDDLMQRDGVKADWFYPGEFRSRTWQGKAYGLPNVTAGAFHLLFVNTKLLAKVGWDPKKPIETWQDLEALVEPAKKAGLYVMDPAKIALGMTGHLVLTYANGGRYWDDNLTKIEWNGPRGVEAAEWLLKFVKAQAPRYEDLAYGTIRNDAIRAEDWRPEKYVTAVNGSWWVFQLPKDAPGIQFATYNFPRNANNPESKGQTPSVGGWMFSIAKAGKDHDAAWEWIKFTAASKHTCPFVWDQSRPSPVIQCNEGPELTKTNPFWPVVLKDLSTNIPVPVTSIHPKFDNLWLEMQDAILYEKMPPKQALDTYAKQGQALLDDWNAKRKK